MKRRKFLRTLSVLPVTLPVMKLNDIENFSGGSSQGIKMPVLFMGHGSPMNAIEENEFVNGWRELGTTIPKPSAILCISAHWETRGTQVTAMEKPATIHDFGGFPRQLYEVQYPAPGEPALARETKSMVRSTEVFLDEKWGLDHGCWSVVRRLYPDADVPVIQMSLDYYKPPQEHYAIAGELRSLRNKGVLIIGSGNIVHNLGLVAWDKLDVPGYGFDWALEAKDKIRNLIISGDHKSLIGYKQLGREVNLAVPTPDHFLPLLYTLALKENNDQVTFHNDKTVAGSLSMTCLKIG